MVLGMLLALARSSRVQTAAIGVVAEQLSRGLGTTVSVGTLNYKFPNRLQINNVLIKDQQHDTLLFVDTLQAHADLWKLISEDTICIRSVLLSGASLNAYQLTDSTMNYQFLVDAFRSDKKNEPSDLGVNLQIKSIRFSRINLRHGDISASIPEANIHLHNLNKDLIDAEIEQFSGQLFRGNVPLDIERLEAHVVLNDSLLIFPTLHLQLPHSNVDVAKLHIDRPKQNRYVDLPLTDTLARLQALGRVHCRMEVTNATFTPSDISAFVPQLKSMNGQWAFTADVSGSVDSLLARSLKLQYRGKELLRGNITVTGLPILENAYTRAECEKLSIDKATLQDIISSASGHPIMLPEQLNRLGKIGYRGYLEGPLDSMILRGAFTTALGSIRTDGRGSFSPDFSDIQFNGQISTRRFNLGAFTGSGDLGTIGFSGHVNGHKGLDHPFHGTMQAQLSHLDFRGYTYHDVQLNGNFTSEQVQAILESRDPNLLFVGNLKASELTSQPAYHLNLELKHFRPDSLHLYDKYMGADLCMLLQADLAGKNIDDLSGQLRLSNLTFAHSLDTFRLNEFLLKAEQSPALDGNVSRKTLSIFSDYLQTSIKGNFLWSTLPSSIMKMAAQALPSAFPQEKMRQLLAAQPNNTLDFVVYAGHLDEAAQQLLLPYKIGELPTIRGNLNDRLGTFCLQAVIPDYQDDNRHLEDITLHLDNAGKKAELSVFALNHAGDSPTAQKMGDMRLYLHAQAKADKLDASFNWTNTDTIHNAGEININTAFHRYANQPLISAHILPSKILLADTLLHIDDAQVTWNAADTTINVNHFRFGSNYQFAHADGNISPRENDTIHIELSNMNLDYYLGALTNVHNAIYFGGTVSGWVTAFSVLSDPKFEAAVEMQHTELNGQEIGDLYAIATLDPTSKHVLIQGDVIDSRLPYYHSTIDDRSACCVLSSDTMPIPPFYASLSDSVRHHGKHVVHVDGEVGTGGNWGLHIYPDSVNVAFVNHWCEGIISNMAGHASGRVDVIGSKENNEAVTKVTLQAKAHNIGLTIPFTGARYYVTDSVFMDSVSLQFHNTHVRDIEGNMILFDGGLRHDGDWNDLTFDFQVNTNHAIVLDLPEQSHEYYGGRVYAKAQVGIHGNASECDINVLGTTQRGTNFVFSLGQAGQASENSFIEFVDHTLPNQDILTKAKQSSSKLNLALLLSVTPEAQISVIIDPRTGDRLKGRGEGDIRFNYSDVQGMSMFGTYTLQQGTFGFTFQNVIRREFQIAEGSRVTWSGNVEEPEVDVRALYRVTASLRDLLGEEAASLTNRSNIPVNCVLNMSDRLFNPVLKFGIELPSSDETVSTQVHSVINTEEMLMRQVLYLLVFNRFYTPEYLRDDAKGTTQGLNETYSLLSSTITGQINSWLSKITDVFSLGFNFRTDGQGTTSSQEYEAQFEIHPVQGLIINGNFGYRYNDISNQPIFGNLDVEYMLTPNGKLRAKAYTHTIDKYSLRQASTVQGLGLVIKHDFNWPSASRRDKSASSSSRREAKQLR